MLSGVKIKLQKLDEKKKAAGGEDSATGGGSLPSAMLRSSLISETESHADVSPVSATKVRDVLMQRAGSERNLSRQIGPLNIRAGETKLKTKDTEAEPFKG